ncbi:MAG TPA: hypothetical protein VG870_13595, partial [Chitinophagaceae bacterium]|nr:hypothetical protein [Chitinophagaceae bacterium]
MRTFLLIILPGLFVVNVSGQASFSPFASKLKTQKSNSLTELICSCSTMTVQFPLKRKVTVSEQNNFAIVDSQTIQIVLLRFSGFKKYANKQSMSDEKQLLNTYSKYELEYFKNE